MKVIFRNAWYSPSGRFFAKNAQPQEIDDSYAKFLPTSVIIVEAPDAIADKVDDPEVEPPHKGTVIYALGHELMEGFDKLPGGVQPRSLQDFDLERANADAAREVAEKAKRFQEKLAAEKAGKK